MFFVGTGLGVIAGMAIGIVLHFRRQASVAASCRVAEARFVDARAEVARLAHQLERAGDDLAETVEQRGRLQAENDQLRRSEQARVTLWEQERERLLGAFADLSAEALQRNSMQFLSLADARMTKAHEAVEGDSARRQQAMAQIIQPLYESLSRYQEGMRQLELDRKGAYAGLIEQVRQINESQGALQKETRNLVSALRTPQTRGRWGEVQLRRVVELAGMVAHCDFDEQVATDAQTNRLRPDMVVHLPGHACLVVDAKVPLDAYLRATETDDDDLRKQSLNGHARQLRSHVDQLSKKEYWSQFETSPEFVVAFVPGDPLLAAAFEHDPSLIEHAMTNRVLLTTPTTLIALLRTVAFGWQQDSLAANARTVQQLGTEMYNRLRVMGGHLGKLQRNLSGAVESFNETVGSFESRVLVTARRFPGLGIGDGGKELVELEPVVSAPRLPQAPELAEHPTLAAVGSDDRVSQRGLEALPGGIGQGLS